jgi:hypothetical protein
MEIVHENSSRARPPAIEDLVSDGTARARHAVALPATRHP